MDLVVLFVVGYHYHPKPIYLENIFRQAFTQMEKSVLFVHIKRKPLANIKTTKSQIFVKSAIMQ